MQLIVKQHAVERFLQRHAPKGRDGRPLISETEARVLLERAMQSGARLKERTLLGDLQIEMSDPRCILVVKHDRKANAQVCVTVLPEREGCMPLDDEGGEDMLRRLAEDIPLKVSISNRARKLDKYRQVVRSTCRWLLHCAADGDAMARELLNEIQAIDPGFVSVEFVGEREKAQPEQETR